VIVHSSPSLYGATSDFDETDPPVATRNLMSVEQAAVREISKKLKNLQRAQ
jgi:hypothetical protein